MSAPVRVRALYSGSEGNSFLIEAPTARILIDAGKSARRLTQALGICGLSPSEIDAILVTHEHSDHVSALPVLLKKYPIPVHTVRASAERLQLEPSVAPCLVLHPPLFEECIGAVRVRSFPTSHDSRASVGYRLEIPVEDTLLCIGYATDLGIVTPAVEAALVGCQAVILESNHDLDMLREGPYPPDLKRRIQGARGHLSNTDSAALVARLAESGMRSLMLAHLSRENNLPEVALAEHTGALGQTCAHLSVASPDEITELDLEEIL